MAEVLFRQKVGPLIGEVWCSVKPVNAHNADAAQALVSSEGVERLFRSHINLAADDSRGC